MVEKNSGNQKENKDDSDYGFQYFNKFQSVSSRLNDLIYYINNVKSKTLFVSQQKRKSCQKNQEK